MGKVKLTLTVDERVVANAKLPAKHQRKSLSQMIEQLLTPARGHPIRLLNVIV